MAHNLMTTKDGRKAFFSVKEKAWHGLGQILENCPTSLEAIQHAGLDYEVGLTPVYANLGGIQMPIEGKFATHRIDTNDIFGIVGSKYTVLQNKDAFKFFDSIVGEGAAIYETAGALGNGQTIFITAKLPEYIKVGNNDLIEQYIFLTSSHDGSGAVVAAFTPVRIVCNNTLNMALRNMSNKVTIRHTASIHDQLEAAHKVMGISHRVADELTDIFNVMAKKSITEDQLKKYIQMSLAPTKEFLGRMNSGEELSGRFSKMVDEVLEYAHSNDTQKLATTKGTVFGAYNAITGYFQNVKDYKSVEARTESIMFGTGFNRTIAAFDLAINLINN